MTRITNTDQIMLLLRQQLQQMSKAERSQRGARTSRSDIQQRQTAASRIEAIAREGQLSEEEFARTLVGALLTDEFGGEAANDHRFQKLVEDVHRIIASDAKAKRLLVEALREIRNER